MTDTGQPALPEPQTDTMTVAEAAVRAGVAERTMRRYVAKKPLWAYRERGRWIIRRAEFLAWLDSRPDAVTDRPAIQTVSAATVRAEAEALRTERDRYRSEAEEAKEDASRAREQAAAWQAQAQQLAEALTRLSLPAHEPEPEPPPEEPGAGKRRRSWLDWFWGRQGRGRPRRQP